MLKALFCTFLKPEGSFTAEAAFTVPLCLFAILLFLGFFRVLQVETCVEQALQYGARTAAAEQEEIMEAGILALSYLQESPVWDHCIDGGLAGISFGESVSEEDYLTLSASYRVAFLTGLFGADGIDISQSVCCRLWTGYDSSSAGAAGEGYVYITPEGSAYHSTTACRYLDLTIRGVSLSEIPALRNKDGGRYYPCRCVSRTGTRAFVYITDYGCEYHTDLTCSSLKRTIYRVPLSEAGGRHPCRGCY